MSADFHHKEFTTENINEIIIIIKLLNYSFMLYSKFFSLLHIQSALKMPEFVCTVVNSITVFRLVKFSIVVVFPGQLNYVIMKR